MLINTNVKHSLEESTYNERRETCESISKTLGKTSLREVNLKELNAIKKEVPNEDFNKALYVLEENNRVVDAHFAIKENNIMKLGKLFFDSHKGLRDKYKVSCRELDYLVDLADRNSNIIGARMMGGGFGGCTINIVKRDAIQNTQEDIAKSFKKTFGNPCSFYPVILSNGTRKISDND